MVVVVVVVDEGKVPGFARQRIFGRARLRPLLFFVLGAWHGPPDLRPMRRGALADPDPLPKMSTAGCLPPLARDLAKASAPASGTTLIGSLLSRSARLLRVVSLQSRPQIRTRGKAPSPLPDPAEGSRGRKLEPIPAGGHRGERERKGRQRRDKGRLMSLRGRRCLCRCCWWWCCLTHCPSLTPSADPMYSADQIDHRVESRIGKMETRRHRSLRHRCAIRAA